MTCADVQDALWAGKKSAEITRHIQACPACQHEMADIQEIVSSLRSLDVPAPSKILIPNRNVIRKTVQRNRKKPFTRLSTIGAAATVILAIATGIGLNHLYTAKNPDDDKHATIILGYANAPKIEVQGNIGNPELVAAVQEYLGKNTSSQEIKQIKITKFAISPNVTDQKLDGIVTLDVDLQPGAVSQFTQGMQQRNVTLVKQHDGKWTVAGFSADKGPTIEESFRTYFLKITPAQGIKSVKVISFIRDQQTDENIMTGKVTLEVDTAAGASPEYKPGTNVKYALLGKAQGVWNVLMLGDTPFKPEDAPSYYRDFAKKAQRLQGTVLDVKTYSFDSEGRMIKKLQSITFKVEKNLSSGGSFASGDTVEIDFDAELRSDIYFVPEKGASIIVDTAPTDPAVTAGEQHWYSKLEAIYFLKDGKHYDSFGKAAGF